MKSQLYRVIFLFVAIGLAACSSDDDAQTVTTPPSNQKLIKKTTETIFHGSGVGTGSNTYIMDFVYNGNELSYTLSGNRKTVFTYDGEKVLTSTSFDDDVLGSSVAFTYDGEHLIKTQSNGNGQSKTEYFYSGNVLVGSKSGYYDSGSNYVLNEERDYVIGNANVLEMTRHNYFFSATHTRMVFGHDNKNNPARYMNKYLRMIFLSEGLMGLGDNNIVSRDHYSPTDATSPTEQQHYEIIYDGDYPVEIKKYSGDYLISETLIDYL